MNISKEISPALKKETKHVAVYTAVGVIVMWAAFALLHVYLQEKVPFSLPVFLGGLGGGAVAVLNFFLMGLTVQQVAATADEDAARLRMRASYSRRMMFQMLWVVVAIAAPCFHFAAGILPLLFPSLGIRINAALSFFGKGAK